MKKILRNNNGSALLITLLIMLMLSLIFISAITTSVTDIDIAKNQRERTSAFYVGEGGLELALRVMRDNFNMLNNDSLESLINATPILGNGNFNVGVTGSSPYKTLTSTGSSRDGQAVVQVTVRRRRNPLNIWDNIIFAGAGQAGQLIAGNVSLHGSVHTLGDSMTSSGVNIDIYGSAGVYNNYSGMSFTLSSRLPALDTITSNGEVVGTLNAELRVKHGTVNLSGTACAGYPNVPSGSPQVKETLDGCYVTDGYGGNQGVDNVHSDNGTSEGYDLGDELSFPDLNDPYTDPSTGTTYPSYMNYLQNNSLVISGDLTLKPGTAVSAVSNSFGSISMDASGNLQISGIVYVAGNITIDAGNGGLKSTPVSFDGQGTLVSQGNTYISTHVISQGAFPTNDALGFISANNIEIGGGSGDSHLNVMGAFFAQNRIVNNKQNQLAGAMVSNYFEIYNVPDLFQVPALVDHMPPGMPGGGTVMTYTYRVVKGTWREL